MRAVAGIGWRCNYKKTRGMNCKSAEMSCNTCLEVTCEGRFDGKIKNRLTGVYVRIFKEVAGTTVCFPLTSPTMHNCDAPR